MDIEIFCEIQPPISVLFHMQHLKITIHTTITAVKRLTLCHKSESHCSDICILWKSSTHWK